MLFAHDQGVTPCLLISYHESSPSLDGINEDTDRAVPEHQMPILICERLQSVVNKR
jgi:hypothetical protein